MHILKSTGLCLKILNFWQLQTDSDAACLGTTLLRNKKETEHFWWWAFFIYTHPKSWRTLILIYLSVAFKASGIWQICFPVVFSKIYSGQVPWITSDLTTGLCLHRWDLEVLHSHAKISAQGGDLCSTQHNSCHVQRTMEDCACLSYLGYFWKYYPFLELQWPTCLLPLKISLLSPPLRERYF